MIKASVGNSCLNSRFLVPGSKNQGTGSWPWPPQGLRIGVSTAKGLCFALDKPLLSVDTLKAMAYGAMEHSEYTDILFCPMIDARRMEVYTALFDNLGNQIEPTVAKIIDEDSFAEKLQYHKVLFFGDGADKCRAALGRQANAVFLPNFTNSATYLTKIAAKKLKKNDFEDVAYFEPYYLKEFIAGIKKN